MDKVYFITNQESLYDYTFLHKVKLQKLREILEEAKQNNRWVSLDIETNNSLDPYRGKIVLIQLKVWSKDEYLLIDLNTVSKKEVAEIFKEYESSITFAGHNLKFEYKWFKQYLGISLENLNDVMLVEQILFNNLPSKSEQKGFYKLSSIAKRWLGILLDKTEQTSFSDNKPFTESQLNYGIEDVKHIEVIYEKQKEFIERYGLRNLKNLECEVLKSYGDIELNGLPLNQEMWLALFKENKIEFITHSQMMDNWFKSKFEEFPKLKKWIKPPQYDLFGESDKRDLSFNWGSDKDVIELFRLVYPEIPIDDYYDVKKKQIRTSVGSDHLEQFENQCELIPLILKYRELDKACNTYGEDYLKYINPITNRIHADFFQLGTKTGRVSVGSPNIQQIPQDERFRNCFEAPKGWSVISIDYAQAEQRIAANNSNDIPMLEGFARNECPYCTKATIMFGRIITRADEERKISKAIVLGKNFGIGPGKLARKLGETIEKGRYYIDLFDSSSPSLVKYLKAANEFAKKNRYSVTDDIYNRRCWLFPGKELAKDGLEQIGRNGQNNKIQGANANLTKLATIKVRDYLKEFNSQFSEPTAFLINQIHDELLLLVRDDIAEEIAIKCRELMIEAGKVICDKVVMDATYVIGQCWIKD